MTAHVTVTGPLTVTGNASFGGAVSVPTASAGGHALSRDTGDGRYGQLAAANTWSQVQTVPAASAGGHALNRDTGDGRYGQLAAANTWSQVQTVPAATAGGHALNRDTADGRYATAGHTHSYLTQSDGDNRYGRLGSSNTWSEAQTFSSTISVGNATAGGHALNRTTGDGRYALSSHTHSYLTQSDGDARYGRLATINTWTAYNTFNEAVYFRSSLIGESGTDLLYRAQGNDHNFQNISGGWANINYGTASQQSDIRDKSGLRGISKKTALDHVRAFSPQDYFLNEDASRRRSGLIAQDVQAIDPDLVTEKDGTLLIDYTGVMMKLMAAVQEIDDRLTAMEKGA